MYSIGEMSRRTGGKIPTIRFDKTRGLLAHPSHTAGNRRRHDRAHDIARRQRQRLRGRIASLQRLEAELDRIATACGGRPEDHVCAVLHAFASHKGCRDGHY